MWETILNTTLDLIASIGSFAQFLFTRYNLSDVMYYFANIARKAVRVNDDIWSQAWYLMRETISQSDFLDKVLNGLSFTPIGLLSVSGLVVILIMGIIKKFSIFS